MEPRMTMSSKKVEREETFLYPSRISVALGGPYDWHKIDNKLVLKKAPVIEWSYSYGTEEVTGKERA